MKRADIDRRYRRVTARVWLRKARADGWGLDGVAWAIRRWQAKHPTAPSPYLLCRGCDAAVLDPVLSTVHGSELGREEIGDMLDHPSESFAGASCAMCEVRKP